MKTKLLIVIALAWASWRFWPPSDPLIFNHNVGEYLGYDEWVETCLPPKEIHHAMTREEWNEHVKEWLQSGGVSGECSKRCRLDGVLTCQKTYHYQPDPFTG